jgi:hypothetical protein
MSDFNPKKIHEAVYLLISKLEGSLTRTKIVKLLYLMDLHAEQELGSSITGIQYKRYFYGPFSKKILSAIDKMNGFEIIERNQTSSKGREYYTYELGNQPRFSLKKPSIFFENGDRDEEKIEIFKSIVKKFGDENTDKILSAVYDTPSFSDTEFGKKIELQ